MRYTFHDGVHAVRCRGRIIVLDERTNRYLGLTPRQEAALLGDDAASQDPGILAPLLRRGLLLQAPDSTLDLSPAHPPPLSSLLEDGRPLDLEIRDLAGCVRAFRAGQRVIVHGRLSNFLGQLRQASPTGSALGAVEADARRFLAARLWMPWVPVCLLDSLALLFFLGAKGHTAQLVIGVSTAPFEAHCWVERDAVVLNETLLRARSFTPILVA